MPKFEIDFNSGDEQWEELIGHIEELQQGGATSVAITVSANLKRSSLQNASLHQGFKHAAQACSEAGITKDMLFRDISSMVQFPATEKDVKEVARAVAEVMYGKRSTTAVPMNEVKKFWDVLQRAFAERLGVDIGDYPCLESQRRESMLKEPGPCT